MATAVDIDATQEIHRIAIANGRCRPLSKGGCGANVGAIENEQLYMRWLRTGLCPDCQGHHVPEHHAPAGCYEDQAL